MGREEFLAAEVLRLDEENSQLRVNNALLQDLLRSTNLVLVPPPLDLLAHPQGAML